MSEQLTLRQDKGAQGHTVMGVLVLNGREVFLTLLED